MVKVSENLAQERATLRNVISDEAERILKAKGYIENVSLLGLKRLSQLIPEELKISEVKAGIEGAKTAMVTLGVVDYYPAQKVSIEHSGTIDTVKTLDSFYTENGKP